MQASEPHRQAPHRCELGGRGFQRIDVGELPGGHLTAGFDAKPRRGHRRDHPIGHWIQRSHADRGWLLQLVTLERRLATAPGCKETRQMTEGPDIATMAYLSERVPGFGNAFGPPPFQQNAEIRRRWKGLTSLCCGPANRCDGPTFATPPIGWQWLRDHRGGPRSKAQPARE